jgi:hypothetical protein
MRSAFRLLALWAASVAASATVQHHWFAAPLDAGFFLLAAVSAAVTLGLMEWLARARLARAEADQQIAFLVAEAVRQRRALERVDVAGLISKAEIEALECRSACRSDIRL